MMPFDSLPERQSANVLKLRQMYDLLNRPYGWCKFSMQKQTGGRTRYCLLGAASQVGLSHDSVSILLGFNSQEDTLKFNDSISRRKKHVLQRIKDAIDESISRESIR